MLSEMILFADQASSKPWWEFILYSPLVAALVPTLLGGGFITWLVGRSLEKIKNNLAEIRDFRAEQNRIHIDAVAAYSSEATSLQATAMEAKSALGSLFNEAPTISDTAVLIKCAANALEAFSRFTVRYDHKFKILTNRHCPNLVAKFDSFTTDFCEVFILLSSDASTRANPARQGKLKGVMDRLSQHLKEIEDQIAALPSQPLPQRTSTRV